jgi:hypothetical protein
MKHAISRSHLDREYAQDEGEGVRKPFRVVGDMHRNRRWPGISHHRWQFDTSVFRYVWAIKNIPIACCAWHVDIATTRCVIGDRQSDQL